MLDAECIRQSRELLNTADFHHVAHAKTFEAAVALDDRNERADLVTLAEELRRRGELDAVGGQATLAQLLHMATTGANLAQYAAIIRGSALKRRLREFGLKIQQGAENPTASPDDALSWAHAEIERLSAAAPGMTEDTARLTSLDSVPPERVDWLWRWRIPLRMVTLLEGNPDVGKSTLLADLSARVSTGRPMPDASEIPEPADVVIVAPEDHLACVVVPRLMRAGADLSRVKVLKIVGRGGTERDPLITSADMEHTKRACAGLRVRLLILDPLFASMPDHVNVDRDHQVRRALIPLTALAEDLGCAVVAVRHWTKSERQNVLHKGGGSIGIIGAARSALVVGLDPDDDTRRVLALPKHNLAPASTPSLAFRLEPDSTGDHCRVTWEGTIAVTASALSLAPNQREDRSQAEEAEAFLLDELAGGHEVLGSEIKNKAKAAGIAERTLWRAKDKLGIVSRPKGGPSARWRLTAPGRDDRDGTDGEPANHGAAGAILPNSANSATPGLPLGAREESFAAAPCGAGCPPTEGEEDVAHA